MDEENACSRTLSYRSIFAAAQPHLHYSITMTISGQSLLYGTRRSRTIDPKLRRKRRAAMTRQQNALARRQLKERYIENLEKGFELLFEGDGALLAETLREPAAHGMKGIEKQQIRYMVESLDRDFWNISRRSNDEIAPLVNHQDIEALVLLADRCQEREISQNYTIWRAERLASLYAEMAANDIIRRDLQGGAMVIGSLPRLIDGDDFERHISAGDGSSLCAKAKHYLYGPRVDQFEHSPASARLECPDCLAAYQKDSSGAEMLDPQQWSVNLDSLNYNNWSDLDGDKLQMPRRDESLSARDWGFYMIEDYYQQMRDSVNDLLSPFTNYRIS